MKRYIACCLILISGLFLKAQKKEISLEDIWQKFSFKQESVTGFRSMNDGLHYTERASNGDLLQVAFKDAKPVRTIANLKSIEFEGKKIEVDDYEFNADESKLLLFTESENIYRRSILHKVYVYDIRSKKVNLLRAEKVLHASFSPQSDKVAYVFANDLYFKDLNTNLVTQITNDGDYNHINGNCDWVYEEEFEFTKAYEWSPRGDYISFYKFDQTEVPEFNFAIYDKLYPTDYKYKYPKAGEKNSLVQICAFNIKEGRGLIYDTGKETDIYFPRIKMNPFTNMTIIYKLNRLQNHLEILSANSQTGKTTLLYQEDNKCYIEINDNIKMLSKRDEFVFTSEKDGYNHLYLHDVAKGTTSSITTGNWEVTEIKGVDEERGIVYYISAEKSPMERNLYSINLDGTNRKCLTPTNGWHTIDFSNNFKYYLDKFSNATTPNVFTLVNNTNQKARLLKDNTALLAKMKDYNLGKLEFTQVPNENGELLNGWVLKPSNFSPAQKYPLLMFQYSGPGSQQVMNQFGGRDFWWYNMLTQQGYIIACFDGTGTGFRGEAFKKKTYLQLGKYESDDQIAVAKYFAKQSYIDANRIGIWGWSYGGFMSSICILKGADIFKTAIAVAPVTNWRYYDNIYTERYMRTPAENASGYDENSPVNMVDKLKGNYLLIHGTADDNVHYQNAVMIIDELIKANKDFDSEIYPNKNHGISGGVTRLQLYRKLTNFILERL
jgi:dipeptidyl-peptidase-4